MRELISVSVIMSAIVSVCTSVSVSMSTCEFRVARALLSPQYCLSDLLSE